MRTNPPNPSPRQAPRRGMTLVELTAMIFVLLSLVSVLFIGARAWIGGSNRANCIVQIRNVQTAVRSYSNLNGLNPGFSTTAMTPPISLQTELIGDGKFINDVPGCPAGGTYTFVGNTIPEVGSLYMTCSLSSSNSHAPDTHSDW